MVTLDEWAEQNAPGLREDIQCHLDNAAPEDQARLILISVRQWATEPKRSRIAFKLAKDVKVSLQENVVDCNCGEFGCIRCAP